MARRSRRPVPVGDILARLLDEQEGGRGVSGGGAQRVSRVLSAFGRIGPPVTEHADAVGFRRGVLTLQVHESAWLTELTFLRTEIIERVNKMVGGAPVREVRLRLGPRRRIEPPPPPPRPLTEAQRSQVEQWAAPIADEAVRDAVRKAASTSLARGSVPLPNVTGPPGPALTPKDPPPPTLTYGFGHGRGEEKKGWTKDRWKARKPSGGS